MIKNTRIALVLITLISSSTSYAASECMAKVTVRTIEYSCRAAGAFGALYCMDKIRQTIKPQEKGRFTLKRTGIILAKIAGIALGTVIVAEFIKPNCICDPLKMIATGYTQNEWESVVSSRNRDYNDYIN